jgi:phospholipid/cholesterol/gamma-HCH transport system ATP-binding protein
MAMTDAATEHPAAPRPGSTPGKTIIALRDVYKSFGRLRVLQGVNLEVEEGKTTVIIGPSGSGKSVILKHITVLLRPDRGEVHFDGRRIDHLSEGQLVDIRTQFGFLFQMAALFDSMTVEQNVTFPLIEHSKMSPKERRERANEALRLVGLEGTGSKMPAEMSGGQRKRVGLARAIALRPRVILYDEPTTGLDPIRSDVINELINKLREELKVTSIAVTHDMHSAYKIADRMVMLYDGKFVADGPPEHFRNTQDPLVRSFVDGRADRQTLKGLESAME